MDFPVDVVEGEDEVEIGVISFLEEESEVEGVGIFPPMRRGFGEVELRSVRRLLRRELEFPNAFNLSISTRATISERNWESALAAVTRFCSLKLS